MCDAVDTAPFEELTPEEETRNDSSEPDADLPLFACEIRMVSEEDAGNYTAISLNAKARIASTVSAAEDAYAGAVSYETEKGRDIAKDSEGGKRSTDVIMADSEQERHCRIHVQSSNAVLSLTLVVSGDTVDCKEANGLLHKVSNATLDAMGSG
ncbi:MAG TPA: hypothetical protein H9902_11465 [Candidatus Stackebrandtia faecavium]|nr:hypothetical protein [Candidatus Stackebrandtia faecavium]